MHAMFYTNLFAVSDSVVVVGFCLFLDTFSKILKLVARGLKKRDTQKCLIGFASVAIIFVAGFPVVVSPIGTLQKYKRIL